LRLAGLRFTAAFFFAAGRGGSAVRRGGSAVRRGEDAVRGSGDAVRGGEDAVCGGGDTVLGGGDALLGGGDAVAVGSGGGAVQSVARAGFFDHQQATLLTHNVTRSVVRRGHGLKRIPPLSSPAVLDGSSCLCPVRFRGLCYHRATAGPGTPSGGQGRSPFPWC